MLASAVAVLTIGFLRDEEPVKVYRDRDLQMEFKVPKSWKVRKERYWTVVQFESAAKRPIRVQFLPTQFRDTAEVWQQLQIDVAKNRRDTVVRQWDEEILGVPLLLTKLVQNSNEGQVAVWSGLIYSRTIDKLNFRVTSHIDDANEAESKWRNALLSIRLLASGSVKPEDPNAKIEPPQKVEPELPRVKWSPPDKAVQRPVRAPNRLKLGEEPFLLYTPEGWSFEAGKLMHRDLKGSISVQVVRVVEDREFEPFDSRARATLEKFDSVTNRVETDLGRNKAQFYVRRLIRTGPTSAGVATIGVFAGNFSGVTWLIQYDGTPDTERSDSRLLDTLLNELSAETGG